jgi:hypothetical protein
MQWEELMRQFADVVGLALAPRWFAQRLTLVKPGDEAVSDPILSESSNGQDEPQLRENGTKSTRSASRS